MRRMRYKSPEASLRSALIASLALAAGCAIDPPPYTDPSASSSSVATTAPIAAVPATLASATAAATTTADAAPSASTTASSAATSPAPRAVILKALPAKLAEALAKDPPRPPDAKGGSFLGPVDVALDGEWITRLATAEIVSVTPNRGGSSVSMRVKFADGSKAALKPEQTGTSNHPRSEIASYHVDRLLGFGRTAAVVGRRVPLGDLRAALVAANADKAFLDRVDKLLVAQDGLVDAALIAWHTASLVPEEAAPAWLPDLATGGAIPADRFEILAERSDLVLFDFLIDNPDRYSGGNILRLGKNGKLVFLDQGEAFGKNRMRRKVDTSEHLHKICRFRKSTLAALRRVDPETAKDQSLGALLQKSLLRDPLAPVLEEGHIAAIDARAKLLAAHVRACTAKLGAAATLAPSERPSEPAKAPTNPPTTPH